MHNGTTPISTVGLLNYENITIASKIYFANDSVGYVFGPDTLNSFVLIRTTDFGNTWTKVTNTPTLIADVQLKDSIGLAVGGDGLIFRSNDFGVTWSAQNSQIATNLTSVSIGNNGICYAGGQGGTLLKSTNNGIDWLPENSGVTSDIVYIKATNISTAYFQSGDRLYKKSSPTMINNIELNDKLTVFPNPVNDVLNIDWLGTGKIKEIVLYNVVGTCVLRTHDTKIDFSIYPEGEYLLELIDMNGNLVHKTIIKAKD